MTTTTQPPGWEQRSACRQVAPDLFFPLRADATVRVRVAKQVCAGCPVRPPCLAEALRNGHPGIWGGTTEDERRLLRPSGLGRGRPAEDGGQQGA